MTLDTPPDFTDAERWTVETAVKERYGKALPVELADSDVRLDPGARELTTCPALYWSERGAHFIIIKTGTDRFRCQFFYSVREQYGTGREEYDDLLECVTTLLRLQADHEKERQGVATGMTAENIQKDSAD